MFFKKALFIVLLTACVCSACADDGDSDGGDDAPARPEPASMDGVTFIVAEEFDPYPEVEALLPILAEHPGIAVCLAIRAEQSQSAELESLLRAAAGEGVPVIAWLLLPEEDGYWFNEENLAEAREQVFAFIDWIEESRIPLKWLMFDMEMSLDKTHQMEGGDLMGDIVPMLQANVDGEAFERSTAEFSRLVTDVKDRGYVVTAAAYPFVLDDLLDEDNEIQDAFNTPIVGVPFDEIYFMAYRTSYASLLGIFPGPYLIYEYAREAKAAFGSKGIMGLGIIGTIGQVSDDGFTKPSQLVEDIAAARAGGNERVFIFSLDGMAASGKLEAWLDLDDTAPAKPEPDDVTKEARGYLGVLDLIL